MSEDWHLDLEPIPKSFDELLESQLGTASTRVFASVRHFLAMDKLVYLRAFKALAEAASLDVRCASYESPLDVVLSSIHNETVRFVTVLLRIVPSGAQEIGNGLVQRQFESLSGWLSRCEVCLGKLNEMERDRLLMEKDRLLMVEKEEKHRLLMRKDQLLMERENGERSELLMDLSRPELEPENVKIAQAAFEMSRTAFQDLLCSKEEGLVYVLRELETLRVIVKQAVVAFVREFGTPCFPEEV